MIATPGQSDQVRSIWAVYQRGRVKMIGQIVYPYKIRRNDHGRLPDGIRFATRM